MSIISILFEYSNAFLGGLLVTLKLVSIVWGSGMVFGCLLGVLGAAQESTIGKLVGLGSFILSGLPLLVLLFWLHYPLQAMLEVVVDPFATASFALGLTNVFVVADIVRVGLLDFPKQYVTAAVVTGLSPRDTLLHIKAPILLRQLLPILLTTQVTMLQATLFASLISVDELFRVAQRINSQIYKPVEIYTALGMFFLAVCLPMNGLAIWLKQRFTRNLSEN
jgi:polar amino acid transport system permease protein